MIGQWNRLAALYVAMTCVVAILLSKQCGGNVENGRQFLERVRMSDDRTVKKVFLGKADGSRKAVLCCAVLYCTVLYCTVVYCAVLYSTVLCCTVLCCTVLYCTDTTGCQTNCS
jgi:hypothetical protein